MCIFYIALMKIALFLILTALYISSPVKPQDVSGWRGPERNGIYHEKNLLRQWPEGGPETAWIFEGIGQGYSSPAFANGKIYLTGMIGVTGYVFILSGDGTLEKKFTYGPEFHESYPGARSVPVVAGNLLYIVSGMGRLLCLDADSGREIWSRDAVTDFGGTNIRWGITENLLIDGDRIFFAPGGKKNNIVALDRFTGSLIWSSPGTGNGDLSAYCSPLLISTPGRQILVTMMENDIVGLDAGDGQFLWSYPHTNRNRIHANNPLYKDGYILAFSAGAGTVKLKLSGDGSHVTKMWRHPELDQLQGGLIILDGHVYGSGHRNNGWFCLDWNTGQALWNSRDLSWGGIISADGKLYLYSEKGELALARPDTEKLEIISRTSVSIGSGEHFSHPVIHNGRLFVRRGNAMIAYNIMK
jgi:outer membrane protein assembly factor BamB